VGRTPPRGRWASMARGERPACSVYELIPQTVRVGPRHAPAHGWRMRIVALTLQSSSSPPSNVALSLHPSSSPPPERSVFATVVAGSSSDGVEDGAGGRASVAYSVQAPSGVGSKASRPGRKSGKRSEKSCPFRILCEYRRKSGTSPPAATARPGSSANIDENPENAFESAAFSGFSSCEPRRPCTSQSAQNGHSGREGLGGNRPSGREGPGGNRPCPGPTSGPNFRGGSPALNAASTSNGRRARRRYSHLDPRPRL
jgi:hypothetical protein